MIDNKFRERKAPSAKVYAYIKDPVYGGTEKIFVEVMGFTQVSTNCSMNGMGSATITFPNFKSNMIRYIPISSITSNETEDKGKETTNFDLLNLMYQGLNKKEPTTGTKAKRSMFSLSNGITGIWRDTITKIISSKSKDNTRGFTKSGRSYSELVENTNGWDSIYDNRISASLPIFNTMDPIFVDFLGQDGFWYAGFSGIINRVSDNYTKMGDQSLILSCSDPTILFDNTSLVSGWHRMSVAENKSNLRTFYFSTEANKSASENAAYPNIFSSYSSVIDIILDVVRTSQDLWRLDDFGDAVGVKGFKYDTNRVYEYHGNSSRRGSVQQVSSITVPDSTYTDFSDTSLLRNIDMDPNYFKNYYELKNYHYVYENNPNSERVIFVDPLIMKFDNIFIHKVLASSLSLYKESVKSANDILNELAAKMMCYKYFDSNGNLIFELPKYNAFPNVYEYGGRSCASVIRHTSPNIKNTEPATRNKLDKVIKNDTISKISKRNGISESTFKKLNNYPNNTNVFTTVTKDGRSFYVLKAGVEVVVGTESQPTTTDPLKDQKKMNIKPSHTVLLNNRDDGSDYTWYTLRFHGINYMLSEDDFISFNTSIDESKLYTVFSSDVTFPYLESFDENIKFSSTSLHGVAVADYDALAKYGVRRYQTQTLYNVTWPKPSNIIGSRVMSYMASAIMDRVNSQADSGTIQMKHRPEMQMGRTFINQLRFKSYLIMGISNTWSPGGDHTTTLTASYGHPIHKALEMPWTAIFAEPTVFGFTEGTTGFSKIQPSGEHGNVKDNEKLEEAS